MIVLGALLFAQGMPIDHSLHGVFKAEDYPQWAMDDGQQGAIALEYLVKPDGSVERCSILVSSGHSQLDRYTCDLLKKRAHFAPATTKAGKPAYGLYDAVVAWGLNQQITGKLNPDVELQIKGAPAGVSLPVDVKVAYLSTAAGAVTGCQAAVSSEAPAPSELVSVACQSLVSEPPAAATSAAHATVDSWREATVRFVQDPTTGSTAR